MQAFEEQFTAYRQQHLGLVGKLVYREESEILDLFPESESAAEVVRDLEALAIASGLQRKLTRLILDQLLLQVADRASVIEVCGGSCWLLRNVVSQANTIGVCINAVGSDLSRRHIEANQETFGHTKIEWSIANATHLLYPDRRFDLALNCQALHHFPAGMVVELLRELKRVARKVLIFDLRRTLYGSAFVKLLSPFYSKSFINDGVVSHRRAYSIQEMEFIIQRAGLPYRVSPFTPVGMLVESTQ
ncbi:MAG: Methyltransferase type 11 [Pseudomonas sp.]|nr:Methyltransferase type 11 [Pseudomonas sp.]